MASLLDEMHHINSFLAAQASIMGPALAAVMEGQSSSLIAKIGMLPTLDAVCATELTTCIANGPWTPDQKNKLGQAVGSRLQIISTMKPATACSGRRRANQSLMSFEKYLKQEHVDYLGTAASDVAKLNVLAELCEQIGLDIPSEQTVKHLIAVFCSVTKKGSVDHSLGYSYLTELKRLLKTRAKSFPHQRPTIYPDLPSDLPQHIYEYAYPGGHVPVDLGIGIREISAASSSLACRKTSRMIRQEHVSSGPSTLAEQVLQSLPQVVAQFCQAIGHPVPKGRGLSAGITIVNRRPPIPEPLPLQDTTVPSITAEAASSTENQPELPAIPHKPSPFSLPPVTEAKTSELIATMNAALGNRDAAKREQKDADVKASEHDPAPEQKKRGRKPGGKAMKTTRLTKAQKLAAAKGSSSNDGQKRADANASSHKKNQKRGCADAPSKSKGKKRDAAHASPKQKKAKGSVKNTKNKVRADTLSMDLRLKLRPKGCARCRRTAGCCPSCIIWK
jgi:hypothetical protein